MPAQQSCDPAAYGRTFNVLMLDVQGVSIEVRWNWDGVSVYPECDGPLVNSGSGPNRYAIRVVNPTGNTFYAHTTRKNGQPATYTLNPGQTVNITAAQASSNGYTKISDFADLSLSTTP